MESEKPGSVIKNERIQCLEAIRGFAAISVLLSHWILWSQIGVASQSVGDKLLHFLAEFVYFPFQAPHGIHPGVVIFIVLSGFSIHMPLVRDPSKGKCSLFWREFAIKRITRIAPAYWVSILLGLCIFLLSRQNIYDSYPLIVQDINNDAPSIIKSVVGFFFLQGIIPIKGATIGNGILSIVAVEMAIYLLYPFSLKVKRHLGWKGIILLALFFYFIAVGLWLLGVDKVSVGVSVWTLYSYWIIGAYVAEKAILQKNKLGLLPLTILITLYWLVYPIRGFRYHYFMEYNSYGPFSLLAALDH